MVRETGKWTGEEITERNIDPDEVSEWNKLREWIEERSWKPGFRKSSPMCTKVLKLKSCLQCNTSSSLFIAYVEQFTHLESYPFLTREVRRNVRRTNQEKGIGREKRKSSKKEGRERRKRKGTRTRIIKVSAFSPSSSASTLLSTLLSLIDWLSRARLLVPRLLWQFSPSFLPSCSITRIRIRIWYLWHHGRDQLPSTTDPSIRGIQDHIQKHHRSDETCKKSRGHWKLVSRHLIQV